jgi:hypothetical protein
MIILNTRTENDCAVEDHQHVNLAELSETMQHA